MFHALTFLPIVNVVFCNVLGFLKIEILSYCDFSVAGFAVLMIILIQVMASVVVWIIVVSVLLSSFGKSTLSS